MFCLVILFSYYLELLGQGARYRAACFAFSFVKTEYVYPDCSKIPGHPDSFERRQKCAHCKFDVKELWNPAVSHAYSQCGRKNEPRNRRKARTVYRLWDGVVNVPVCISFFKETFGLGKDGLKTLAASAGNFKLAAFKSKGRRKTEKELMCREFIASVPRHYSHFSVSSSNEYVDCASSALNWWRGPLECNGDGTTSPCFLEWLDQRHQTNHLQVYKESGWFPGVSKGDMPRALLDAEAFDLYPTPAVSYNFFWTVLSKLQIKYKDKAIDQCAKCNVLRGKIDSCTVPGEAAMLIAELEAHQVKADKGYIHRAICITQSASDFSATILPPPSVTCFPPPAPPVEPHLYPDAMDFVQVDMGGGQRTPKIKAGPQYYLRTLPSLPLYICSATPRGTVAMWWNETIAHRGADEMISCQYLYDTTRATGAGTKRLWLCQNIGATG